MKKLVLVFITTVLLLVSSTVFANNAQVSTTYDAEDNIICRELEKKVIITDPRDISNIAVILLNYSRNYYFNESYSFATNICTPEDFAIFSVYDNGTFLVAMGDDIVCTQKNTGRKCVIPVKKQHGNMKFIGSSAWFTYYFVINQKYLNEFWSFLDEDHPIEFSFSFIPSATDDGDAKRVTRMYLDQAEVNELKHILHYNLFEDVTQADNIKKAIEATKKTKNGGKL